MFIQVGLTEGAKIIAQASKAECPNEAILLGLFLLILGAIGFLYLSTHKDMKIKDEAVLEVSRGLISISEGFKNAIENLQDTSKDGFRNNNDRLEKTMADISAKLDKVIDGIAEVKERINH